jgi:hypothetical protein
MSETIEAPKVKRTYKRKPKSVVPLTTGVLGVPPNDEIPAAQSPVVSDSDVSTTSSDLSLTPPEKVPTKPKRTYKKKGAIAECVEPPPQSRTRETTELIDTPPSSPVPECARDKKPRTEKQIEAFNRMREARLKKQEELNRLKDLEKEEKRIDSERKKLEAVTERVVEKATEIKKKRQSRKKPVEEYEEEIREPQHIQEKTFKQLIFV